jgi:molybdopterin/thiamine biosynthesis adenylyltransferase
MAGRNKESTVSRYSRQEVLPQVGEVGQRRLRRGHALVVGAGALGCPVLQYLTGAGVGKLTIVDHDRVDRSNLHRQPLYGEASLGEPKALAAHAALQNLNPDTLVRACVERLDPANAQSLIADTDVILDCADSFAATYILSDTAYALGKPFVSASVLGLNGYAGGFCASAPSLRAVFPELPANTATCTTAGVLGPVAAALGCVQAQMALAVLLGLKPSPLGQLVVFDLQNYNFRSFRFDGAPEPASQAAPFIARSAIAHTDLIVDLRGAEVAPVPVRPEALRATVDTFVKRNFTPPSGQRVVLCCRSGLRAWRAASALRSYWDGSMALLAIGDDEPPRSKQ